MNKYLYGAVMTDSARAGRASDDNPLAGVQWKLLFRERVKRTPELERRLSSTVQRIVKAHLRELEV